MSPESDNNGPIGTDEGDNSRMTLWSLVDRVITDWRRFVYFVGALIVVTALIVGGVWGVLRVAAWNRLEISQTATGGLIYRVGPEQTLTFLLSASSPWAPAEMYVKKGEHLRITASGQVSLAIHHLVLK